MSLESGVSVAWVEDRRQFLVILLLFVAGIAKIFLSHDAFDWSLTVLILLAAGWQAYAVFVTRPRRLARTGQRSKPGS